MSLQHYCSFLLADQPSAVTFDKESVLSLREKLKRWSSSYKRENTRRRWEKMEEDRSVLITPEKIREFERSQAAREAIVLLGKLCGAHAIQITQEMYTLVRDYLIAQIMIDNANRAGVVACMTVKEFESATVEGDRHVVRVLHHKTVDTHGPAQIVLTSHLYNYITVFMQEMRSQLPDLNLLDKQTVFLSWCGKHMESSQMTKALGSIFKKAGVDGPVHHTLYRKSAVSRCHNRHKEISSNLADLMAHREDTAQKYYRVFEKGKSSVKASQKLHQIMRNTDESSETNQQAQTSLQEVTEDDTEIQERQNIGKPERVPWKEESISALKTLFAEEITAQDITFACVKEKIKGDPILSTEDPKRVYDKIRAEWRFKAKLEGCSQETVSLPEEQETIDNRVSRMFQAKEHDQLSNHSSDVMAPTDTTWKSQGLFTNEQVQTLLRLFQSMINGSPISKPKITSTLEADSIGRPLLQKFTLAQIVNRLKYERKQKREKN